MFKYIYILLILSLIVACSTKTTTSVKSTTISEVIVQPIPKSMLKDTFPFSWFGLWEGTLQIYNNKGLVQSLPMQLDYQATDTMGVYKWHIIYGEDREKGLRPYMLRTLDATKGLYLNDEMNTIKMESYYLGGKLFCNFSVGGNWLTTIQEKKGEELYWEIVFGKEAPISITGNQVVKGDSIPAVKTMPIVINQRAILKRKK